MGRTFTNNFALHRLSRVVISKSLYLLSKASIICNPERCWAPFGAISCNQAPDFEQDYKFPGTSDTLLLDESTIQLDELSDVGEHLRASSRLVVLRGDPRKGNVVPAMKGSREPHSHMSSNIGATAPIWASRSRSIPCVQGCGTNMLVQQGHGRSRAVNRISHRCCSIQPEIPLINAAFSGLLLQSQTQLIDRSPFASPDRISRN
ncbi:hypothetical protein CLF_106047 [Clonorchis sinensis]|uniref:Uncharacterized protein n=1 Tax=Clonorchis sinensis TaxID=79923 RepID=G7YEL5_CLOSI|nr:hypothetical protein CLF_106047 [Clonorchis sinensis]